MQYKTAQHTSSCLKFWIKVNLNFKWSQGKLPLPTEPVYTAEFDPANYTNKHLWAFASALVGHYFTSWQEGIEQQRNTANEKAWAGCSIVYSSLCWMNNGSPLLDFFWTFFNGRPLGEPSPAHICQCSQKKWWWGCLFLFLFIFCGLFAFIWQLKIDRNRGEREEDVQQRVRARIEPRRLQ